MHNEPWKNSIVSKFMKWTSMYKKVTIRKIKNDIRNTKVIIRKIKNNFGSKNFVSKNFSFQKNVVQKI